ncbi:MAG: methylisocitrate lyase [Pirellulaceae bacterium]|nr:methylisocitrate lyase [Pirellulaceae bacterium]
MTMSAGKKFRDAIAAEQPLQVVGTINALTALMAEQLGFRAIYLSGAGVANASYGVPDLGMTGMTDVETDIRRITSVTSLPLLVDADTGWGHAFNVARTVKSFTAAGAAGMHLEDQLAAKRCGHRPGKALADCEEMCDRIRAAVDAKTDPDFVIMARTDALASEGLDGAIARAQAYVAAGADMIFAEAVTEAEQYRVFTQSLDVPVLANMTEFGQSPLLTREALGDLGIRLILYPLSAFRAMNAAAENVYRTIREKGIQSEVLGAMQTRSRLYEILHYHDYETKLDQLFSKGTSS